MTFRWNVVVSTRMFCWHIAVVSPQRWKFEWFSLRMWKRCYHLIAFSCKEVCVSVSLLSDSLFCKMSIKGVWGRLHWQASISLFANLNWMKVNPIQYTNDFVFRKLIIQHKNLVWIHHSQVWEAVMLYKRISLAGIWWEPSGNGSCLQTACWSSGGVSNSCPSRSRGTFIRLFNLRFN